MAQDPNGDPFTEDERKEIRQLLVSLQAAGMIKRFAFRTLVVIGMVVAAVGGLLTIYKAGSH